MRDRDPFLALLVNGLALAVAVLVVATVYAYAYVADYAEPMAWLVIAFSCLGLVTLCL